VKGKEIKEREKRARKKEGGKKGKSVHLGKDQFERGGKKKQLPKKGE